jgi:hypothetical protein
MEGRRTAGARLDQRRRMQGLANDEAMVWHDGVSRRVAMRRFCDTQYFRSRASQMFMQMARPAHLFRRLSITEVFGRRNTIRGVLDPMTRQRRTLRDQCGRRRSLGQTHGASNTLWGTASLRPRG